MRWVDEYGEVPDEYYEEQHRRKLQRQLAHLPPGHPDEGDLLDALEGHDDDQTD